MYSTIGSGTASQATLQGPRKRTLDNSEVLKSIQFWAGPITLVGIGDVSATLGAEDLSMVPRIGCTDDGNRDRRPVMDRRDRQD
jgi:hypothetical protein